MERTNDKDKMDTGSHRNDESMRLNRRQDIEVRHLLPDVIVGSSMVVFT